MYKRPTRSDVARHAGVSVATVSYVMNNGPRCVSRETHQRVMAAIEALGYRPHAIARSLRTGRSQTVGLLVPSLVSPYIAALVNAIEDSLANYGYRLILASSHEDSSREYQLLEVLSAQSIDGLLHIPMSASNTGRIELMVEEGFPVVFVDRYIPGIRMDVVMSDNIHAAYQATRYLIEQGAYKNLCISFSPEASSAKERVEGFVEAHRQAGVALDEEKQVLVLNYSEWDTLERILTSYIARYGCPQGILCTTDVFIIDTVRVMRKQNIRIPQQVRIAGGFANKSWFDLLESSIYLVTQNFNLVAQRAVECLIERINGKKGEPGMILIPMNYENREN